MQHRLPQDGIDAGLVAFAVRFKPLQNVGVNAHRGDLFDGPVKGVGLAFFQNSSVNGAMSLVSICLSGMAARDASSAFCWRVRGDHVATVMAALVKLGYAVKRSSG